MLRRRLGEWDRPCWFKHPSRGWPPRPLRPCLAMGCPTPSPHQAEDGRAVPRVSPQSKGGYGAPRAGEASLTPPAKGQHLLTAAHHRMRMPHSIPGMAVWLWPVPLSPVPLSPVAAVAPTEPKLRQRPGWAQPSGPVAPVPSWASHHFTANPPDSAPAPPACPAAAAQLLAGHKSVAQPAFQ